MSIWEIAEVLGRLPNASNATLLARTTDDELVVYKPEKGERPLWDFEHGTLAAREVLTYEVARATGFDLVPATTLIDGPFGQGSAQRYIEEDFEFDPVDMINNGADDLWPVAVLDVLINNADRKAGHIIAETDTGHLWCIDHGVSFHEEPKLRTVLWAFSGRPIPTDMLAAVQAVQAALDDDLHTRIRQLLSATEADAVSRRVADLLTNPVHPPPPTDRPPVPWPIW